MKYISFILLYTFFLSDVVMAQISVDGKTNSGRWVCFYNCTGSYNEIADGCKKTLLKSYDKIDPAVNPYEIFDGLVSALEKESGSTVYNISYSFEACDLVCNAASMLTADGLQMVYYNPLFINQITLPNENKQWAVRCIFAHEIGHHIFKHSSIDYSTVSNTDKQRAELRADFFSGFLIRRFNGTVDNSLQGLLTLDSATYKPSNTEEELNSDYPTLERRKLAVIAGYNAAVDSQTTINMLADIKKFALGHGIDVLYRVTDKGFKMGDLDILKESITKYLQDKGFSEDEIFQNADKLNDLKKVIKKDLNVKPDFDVKNNGIKIKLKPADIEKVKALNKNRVLLN